VFYLYLGLKLQYPARNFILLCWLFSQLLLGKLQGATASSANPPPPKTLFAEKLMSVQESHMHNYNMQERQIFSKNQKLQKEFIPHHHFLLVTNYENLQQIQFKELWNEFTVGYEN